MKYMLYHVGHRLWFHKYAYGLLLLELAVSIGIFAAGLNLLFSNERILDSYRETLTKTKTVIYHNSTAHRSTVDGGLADLPVRYEDYMALEEQFSDEAVIYYAANYTASAVLFLYGKINEMHPVEFIFMNDAMFEDMFSFKRADDRLYVGSRAADFLDKAGDPSQYALRCYGAGEDKGQQDLSTQKINAVCSNFRMEDGKIVLDGDHALEWEPIPDEEKTPYIVRSSIGGGYMQMSDHARWDIRDCIIGSTDMLAYLSDDYEPFDSVLQLCYREKDFDPAAAAQMANWLSSRRWEEGYKFSVSSKLYTMQQDADAMETATLRYLAVAAVIFVIGLAEGTGLVQRQLFLRREDLKTACCCGAEKGQCFGEIYMETVFVFLLGGILGLVGASASALLTDTVGAAMAELMAEANYPLVVPVPVTEPVHAVFHPELILPVVLLCLMSGLFCVTLVVLRTRK